jgi:hypothetical protein
MNVDFLNLFRLQAAARQDIGELVGFDYLLAKTQLAQQEWREQESARARRLAFETAVQNAFEQASESAKGMDSAGKDTAIKNI